MITITRMMLMICVYISALKHDDLKLKRPPVKLNTVTTGNNIIINNIMINNNYCSTICTKDKHIHANKHTLAFPNHFDLFNSGSGYT